MKNTKNKHRLRRRLELKLKRSGKSRLRKHFWFYKQSTYNGLGESVEVVIFELDHALMKQKVEQDPWYNTLLMPGMANVAFVEILPDVAFTQHSFNVMKVLSHVHEKIILGKGLRYQVFYNQAFFTFRKIGKPALGVSPPLEETLQAA